MAGRTTAAIEIGVSSPANHLDAFPCKEVAEEDGGSAVKPPTIRPNTVDE